MRQHPGSCDHITGLERQATNKWPGVRQHLSSDSEAIRGSQVLYMQYSVV